MRTGRHGLAFFFAWLPLHTLAENILSSTGFVNCAPDPDIHVRTANIQFDRDSGKFELDVSGFGKKQQNVTASLVVTAYGSQVYTKDFDPCDISTKVDQLCPVPAGTFSAKGVQQVPPEFISQIPSIAFSVPDVDAEVVLKLHGPNSAAVLGCIETGITNGKTMDLPAVSYVAVSMAGAALALSGLSALGNAGATGQPGPSVGFTTIVGWFQSVAVNGMLSVNYPPVYRSFAKNFAFSGGLIPWNQLQLAIDGFRGATGGNLTEDSVQYLHNSALAYGDGSSNATSFVKRHLPRPLPSSLKKRLTTLTNDTELDGNSQSGLSHITHGITGYVEQLMIPQANTFMTVLLIFAIVIAAIAVGILLFKVLLEAWALFGSFPKRLTSFRKRYWSILAKAITNLILLLYGIWTLYCVFQFTNGDSWAAKALAAATFIIFTAILGFFTFKITSTARKLKQAQGDVSALYENKETWIKYSLFYDVYKRGYWWIFMPVIVYMFAKGCVLAAGNGHGLAQTSSQLIIETIMLFLLLWHRPYATSAGNWINIVIQVVRVLSVICILVFVEQLGIAQTTKTVTGIILIAVQAGLTVVLGILIAINAITILVKENPHRRQRKEAEKLNCEFDNLTPLDARNSLLVVTKNRKSTIVQFDFGPLRQPQTKPDLRPSLSRTYSQESRQGLVHSAAEMGHKQDHSRSLSRDLTTESPHPLANRQPTLPDVATWPKTAP